METDDATRGQVLPAAALVYEELFVPALFAQWTGVVLDAAGVGPGDRVLDIGCGTGVLARAAAVRVGPGGSVVGVDCNEGMLAVARRSGAPVTWRHGAAESLPVADGSFDRVVGQFVLMFVDDRDAAVGEMARVLAPGGTVALATWAAVEESPGYAAMVELLRRCIGEHAAQALLAPFCLGAPDALRDVLRPAFPDATVERHDGTARFPSLDAWLHTEIRGWTLAGAVDDATFERLVAEARLVMPEHVDVAADGAVSFAAPALVVRASAPR